MKYRRNKFDVEGGVNVCCGACYCSRAQRLICRIFVAVPLLILFALILTILIRTAIVEEVFQLRSLSEEEPTFINATKETQYDWAAKLGGAIKIQTVSTSKDDISYKELVELRSYLFSTFPAVFGSAHVTEIPVNDYSILLRVQGSQDTGNPYMLAAHMDVVPPGNLDKWDHPPFLGEVINQDGVDYVYGRGAIDDKHSLIGILQALESLLEEVDQPNRTFYLAFGHDEEVSGYEGAASIALVLEEELAARNESLAFILDEGLMVNQDIVPGQDDPVITIGVVEKGWVMMDITAEGVQGHSSLPPRESAIGILSKALSNLEENPHPSRFGDGPEYDTLRTLAPSATFLYKMVLSNLWLFSPIVSSMLAGDSVTDALQRTTLAITMINAGVKENVIPSDAQAVVNHRVYPLSNEEEVLQHNREAIDDDRVIVESRDYFPPSPISPYSDESIPYQIVANSAVQVFPTGHVAPGIMIANTDCRHYLNLTSNIYRFSPAFITPNDTSRFHGVNERISVENVHQVVQFYYRVMRNAEYSVEPPGAGLLSLEEGAEFEPENETLTLVKDDMLLDQEELFVDNSANLDQIKCDIGNCEEK